MSKSREFRRQFGGVRRVNREHTKPPLAFRQKNCHPYNILATPCYGRGVKSAIQHLPSFVGAAGLAAHRDSLAHCRAPATAALNVLILSGAGNHAGVRPRHPGRLLEDSAFDVRPLKRRRDLPLRLCSIRRGRE